MTAPRIETGAVRTIRFLDERLGTANFLRRTINKIFPDNWSFMIGELALYCFVTLLLTGVYLTFFFEPSTEETTYRGSYEALRGVRMTRAYASALDLSFDVRAGLLMRQIHHWAALLFLATIVVHLGRVFFTGAFRKPREITYWIGVTMLVLALMEGYLGYSLADDLLSGMGLAIGYSVAASIPFVGANLAALLWGGPFPGSAAFWPRMYVAHVFLLPIAIGALLTVHLILVALRHHTQFRQQRETERRIVGAPLYPAQVPRSLGLMSVTAGALFLLVGMIYDRCHTRVIADLGGLQKVAPMLAATFMVVMLSSVGLPGLNGFAGEFLILLGSFGTRRWWTVAAASGVILAAVYLLWAYQRVFHGEPDEANAATPDLKLADGLVLAPLLAAIVFVGVYPKPMLERIEPAVDKLIAHVEQHSDYREPEVAKKGTGIQTPVAAESTEEHE